MGMPAMSGSLACLHQCVCTSEPSEWLPATSGGSWRQTGKTLGKVWWRKALQFSAVAQRCFMLEGCLLVTVRCAQKLWRLHGHILWWSITCSFSNWYFCCPQIHIFVTNTATLRLRLLGIALKSLKFTALKKLFYQGEFFMAVKKYF